MVEVPLDAGEGGCKTLHGAEVENQPKHAGKDEPESASVRVFRLNAREHVTLNVLGSTNTVDVHASVNPPDDNWDGEEKDNKWSEDNLAVLTQELACTLNDCSTNSDLLPQGADSSYPDASKDTSNNCNSQGVLLVLRATRRFVKLHAGKGGKQNTEKQDSKHRAVNQWLCDPIEQVKVARGDEECDQASAHQHDPSLR